MKRVLLVCALVFAVSFMGCAHSGPTPTKPPSVARFFLESPDSNGQRATLPLSETEITVGVKPVLTEFDLSGVEIAQLELGKCLQFRFTPAASRDLYRLSASNPGRRLVLTIDGQAMGARRVDGPIHDGVLLIFVETPDDALPALQAELARTSSEIQRVAQKL